MSKTNIANGLVRAPRVGSLIIGLVLAIILAGCAPAQESFVTIDYSVDGAEKSITMHPQAVKCDETSVSGRSSTSRPVGMFTFLRERGGEARSGTAAITDSDHVFVIDIQALDLDTSEDGTVKVAKTVGDVSISPNEGSGGKKADPQAVVTVEGSLSAELHCTD